MSAATKVSEAVSEALHWLGLSPTAGPAVAFTTLPASFFKLPPAPEPATVPPPAGAATLAHPFAVPGDLYNALLSPHVPVTVALVYASLVALLNSVNANRKHKPWAFSQTKLFKLMVIVHNLLLAAYSAWTFVGMLNALQTVLPPWDYKNTLADTTDALCKMHGPRGHGSAATYNATTDAWQMTNRLFHLAADGLGPEPTDAGRMWNEGLAFYGWLFYLSKFYEVVDTFIILAKGKKSSLLQTYHHAGAMLCMWAGIRFMSPPIWMFVLVNSGIHAVMYTFYLCSVIGIRIPKWFKQTLTTFQIAQFVVGVFYAFLHLFIAYQIPVSVPYVYHLGDAVSKIASAVPADATSAASTALATASAGVGAWLKKIALRAAGHEGLAENVVNEQGQLFGIDAIKAAEDFIAREEIRFRDELQWVHCLDTSGQVFAILLNCLYLLPLTWLFVQFFIQAYLKRIESRRSSFATENAAIVQMSFHDAGKKVARRLSEAFEEMHHIAEDISEDTVLVDGDEVREELRAAAQQAKAGIAQSQKKLDYMRQRAERVQEEVKKDIEEAREAIRARLSNAKSKAIAPAEKSNGTSIEAAGKGQNGTQLAKSEAKAPAEEDTEGWEKASPSKKKNKKKSQGANNTAAETAEPVKSYATVAAENVDETVIDLTSEDSKKPGEERAKKVEETTSAATSNAVAEISGSNGATAEQPASKATESSSDGAAEKDSANETEPGSESETKSPNGNGTGAEEASGQPQPNPQNSVETGESTEVKQEKAEEDKAIDESQPVRDVPQDQDTDDVKKEEPASDA